MTSLKNLTIKNFRGFDTLEIDDFSQINLFVGKNNSGKTSILESIFLLMGMSNPMLPSNINKFRGLNITSAKQLKYLFHNLKIENKPSFAGIFSDGSERQLNIDAKYFSSETPTINTSVSMPEIMGLDLNFAIRKKHGQKISHKSSVTFDNDMINQKLPEDYSENQYAVFVSPDKNDLGALSRYSEVIKRKAGDSILKSLQSFDNDIKDIQLLPDGIYFDMKNISELVPSNVMGDGVRRFLNITTAVAERQDSVVCIDEIENGLHYSGYKLLWESLISFSKLYNVQLFISTHNIETLTCLKDLLEQDVLESTRELTRVFAVSKTLKAGYKAYKYSYAGFKDAIEHETEIRN